MNAINKIGIALFLFAILLMLSFIAEAMLEEGFWGISAVGISLIAGILVVYDKEVKK